MKKTFTLLVLLLLGITHHAIAQNKSIYLVDSATRVPVQSATVQNENASFFEISDENGWVSLAKIPENSGSIVVKCIGFQSKIIPLASLAFDNNKAIIYLSQKIINLQEVTIQAASTNDIFNPISQLDIHLRPINNSQEVLRVVPGLFIGQHAGGGKAEQIFLRGFDIDHGTDINITVDGLPVNMVSHAHGQGYADLHFVIPELIEQVNFNKGTYFADKGNFTTAGFVEFKTKDYLDNSFVKIEGGQFSTFRSVVGINLLKPDLQMRKQSLYFAGEGSFTRGYFDSPQDFNRFNGTLKYRARLNDNHTFTATATAFSSRWNASGQIPERAISGGLIGWYGAIDNTEGGSTARYNVNTEILSNFNNGATLRNQLYYSKYDFELYSNFTFFKEDPVNGDQIRQKENRNIIGYHSTFEHDYYVGKFSTTTKAGIQLRYDNVSDLELTRTKNRDTNIRQLMFGDVQELNAAAYYSQKIALNSRLNITGALRFDYFTNQYNDQLMSQNLNAHSTIVSPKLNINYQLNEHVQLYLYNGRGFHSNDTRVAVQENGKKVVPPAYGSDLGGIFKVGKKLVLQSAVWYLWLDQEFIYVGDEGVVEAGGQTQRFGFDVSARYELTKNLYADMDISWANPRALNTLKTESFLPLAPRLTSVGGITYRNQYGWNGSLRYRFMGDRPANEDNSLVAKGYMIADASINYTKRKWSMGLSVQNILNTKWKETQFDTESQLRTENEAVSEIHFTPGTPFFARLSFTVYL
jgi:hypothetical protein